MSKKDRHHLKEQRTARHDRLAAQPWFDRATPRKQQAYLALEDPLAAGPIGQACGIGLFVLIVLNAFLLSSNVASLDQITRNIVGAFSAFSTVVFAFEYLCRIWVADMLYPRLSPFRARLRYLFSLLGIIDLLSFVPSMIMWFAPGSAALKDAVRIIRLVRLIKVTRYMRGLRTINLVFEKRRNEIVAAFMLLALLTIASSVLMYEAEHQAQPDRFDSVLTGIYWAMTTITTTGYGDLVPITPIGRFIGFITMVLAIGAIAIPSGIFSAGFVEAFRNQRLDEADCVPKDAEDILDDAIDDLFGKE